MDELFPRSTYIAMKKGDQCIVHKKMENETNSVREERA
jgi:hypothetical protein